MEYINLRLALRINLPHSLDRPFEPRSSSPFFGAILTPLAGNRFVYLNVIWSLRNIGNAIMAVPNLIGLLMLAGAVAAVTRERL